MGSMGTYPGLRATELSGTTGSKLFLLGTAPSCVRASSFTGDFPRKNNRMRSMNERGGAGAETITRGGVGDGAGARVEYGDATRVTGTGEGAGTTRGRTGVMVGGAGDEGDTTLGVRAESPGMRTSPLVEATRAVAGLDEPGPMEGMEASDDGSFSRMTSSICLRIAAWACALA